MLYSASLISKVFFLPQTRKAISIPTLSSMAFKTYVDHGAIVNLDDDESCNRAPLREAFGILLYSNRMVGMLFRRRA